MASHSPTSLHLGRCSFASAMNWVQTVHLTRCMRAITLTETLKLPGFKAFERAASFTLGAGGPKVRTVPPRLVKHFAATSCEGLFRANRPQRFEPNRQFFLIPHRFCSLRNSADSMLERRFASLPPLEMTDRILGEAGGFVRGDRLC